MTEEDFENSTFGKVCQGANHLLAHLRDLLQKMAWEKVESEIVEVSSVRETREVFHILTFWLAHFGGNIDLK